MAVSEVVALQLDREWAGLWVGQTQVTGGLGAQTLQQILSAKKVFVWQKSPGPTVRKGIRPSR